MGGSRGCEAGAPGWGVGRPLPVPHGEGSSGKEAEAGGGRGLHPEAGVPAGRGLALHLRWKHLHGPVSHRLVLNVLGTLSEFHPQAVLVELFPGETLLPPGDPCGPPRSRSGAAGSRVTSVQLAKGVKAMKTTPFSCNNPSGFLAATWRTGLSLVLGKSLSRAPAAAFMGFRVASA